MRFAHLPSSPRFGRARVAICAAIVGCGFPVRTVAAQELMAMNRAGRWAEVVQAGQAMLRDETLPVLRRCEAYASVAYAAERVGQMEAARAAVRGSAERCGEFPEASWFRGQVRDIGARLGSAPAAAASGAPAGGAGWTVQDPAAAGLDTAALARYGERCQASGADACLVAYRGRIVQEWYGPGYRYPMPTMSSVKSWTGLLAGLLLADGRLAGLDEPVARWIPEWKAGAEAGVTLRHLLTMTSGLRRRWGRGPGDEMVGATGDKNALVLSLPLARAPGREWEYSNEGVQLLSPLLERAAGMPLQEYARQRLFAPLGMDSTSLRLDAAGHAWTYADARTTLRDFAKICQLALDGGRWNGVQVVPAEWIRASLTPAPQNAEYGLLWWLGTAPERFGTRGYLDTDCDAFPATGLVVARMQSRPHPGAPVAYRDTATLRAIARIVPPSAGNP